MFFRVFVKADIGEFDDNLFLLYGNLHKSVYLITEIAQKVVNLDDDDTNGFTNAFQDSKEH